LLGTTKAIFICFLKIRDSIILKIIYFLITKVFPAEVGAEII